MNPEVIWQEVFTYLEGRKQHIADEIMHYPPPIPACDLQFNYLLEERARIGQLLRALEELRRQAEGGDEIRNQLGTLIDRCGYVEGAQANRWRQWLAGTDG